MTKEHIKTEYQRLTYPDDIVTNLECLDIFILFFKDLMLDQHKDDLATYLQKDGRLIMQMILSRCLTLKQICKGVNIETEGITVFRNSVVDPTIISSHVRLIYEMVCLFNLIYDSPETNEISNLVHKLWMCAGLRHRQRFQSLGLSPENLKKADLEMDQINEYENEIFTSETYSELSEPNQKKINVKLKAKDFKIKVLKGEVQFLSWQDISNEMVQDKEARTLVSKMYTYFSLYSHPSYVSVFQFDGMFKTESDSERLVVFNIQICTAYLSMFIGDYLGFYPKCEQTLSKQPLLNQIVLNHYNKMYRGESRSFSDSWKKLG